MNARVLVVLIGVVLGLQVLTVGAQAQPGKEALTEVLEADTTASWGYPTFIESEEVGDALYPSLDMNEAGHGVAVWIQSPEPEGLIHSIWANRHSVSGVWAGPEKLSSTDDLDCTSVRASVDPQGNVMVVWTAFGNGAFSVWSIRYSVSAGWGTPELIDPSPTPATVLADVVCDNSGNAFAFWLEYGSVKSSIYVPGVGWGPKESVSTHGGWAQPASFEVDALGNAIVVWYDEIDFTGSVHRIWCNRYVVGAGWGTDEMLMSSWGVGGPLVAVDDAGNAVAVWFETKSEGGFSPRDTWSSRYTLGTGWSAPELIDTGSTGYSWNMRFASDGVGSAIVVWQELQTTTGMFDMWTMKYSSLTGWSPKVEIGTSGYNPDIDVNHDGLAVLVWMEWGQGTVLSSRCNPQTEWTPPELVGSEGSQDLCVAVDGSGDAIAVWMMYYEQSNIYGNRYGGAPQVISATVAVQPEVVNSASMGKWITVYIDLPEDFKASDIAVGSILLNGEFPVTGPGDYVDYDKDKAKELMVKFEWQKVFPMGLPGASQTITLTITGWMSTGMTFEGSDTVTLLVHHSR